MTIIEALQFVSANGNGYAKIYADSAIENWDRMGNDGRHAQLLYVMSNFSSCRKTGAIEAKVTIQQAIITVRKPYPF